MVTDSYRGEEKPQLSTKVTGGDGFLSRGGEASIQYGSHWRRWIPVEGRRSLKLSTEFTGLLGATRVDPMPDVLSEPYSGWPVWTLFWIFCV